MEENFVQAIARLKDPASADAQNAALMLTISPMRVPTVIQKRMSNTPNFFDSIMSISTNTRNHEAQSERQFAEKEWMPPDLWITFVAKLGNDLKQQVLLQQQQVRQAQLQEQQLRQQQPHQQTLTPKQHEELQQLTRLMIDNWERIRGKLSNCKNYHTNALSEHLNITCLRFIRILKRLDIKFPDSLFDETLNVEQQKQVADYFGLDPNKWLYVINFLRELLRRPFTQPDESHDHEDASRTFAASPSPDRGRLTPFPVSRRDGSHNLDQIKARLYTVIRDETRSEQCIKLIMNVMKRELEPITDAEYVHLFGGADSTEPLLPVEHILLESFKDNGFDQKLLDDAFDEAFKYACHAYLHAEHADPKILSNLKRSELEPKQLYVIARLMRHFLTFDRTEYMLGGKKSRSKKRGRKSVHRRKKSSHKKRKSKKN